MTSQPMQRPRRSPLAVLVVFAALALVAGIVAGCSLLGGELTGRTWQMTSITETVPAFQATIPARTRRATRSRSTRTGPP